MIDEIIFTDGEMIFAAVIVGASLVWLAMKSIANSNAIDELKKKDELSTKAVTELRELYIGIKHSIDTLNLATAKIDAGFERQEQRRQEVLAEIKSNVASAVAPLQAEIKIIHRAMEGLQKKSE